MKRVLNCFHETVNFSQLGNRGNDIAHVIFMPHNPMKTLVDLHQSKRTYYPNYFIKLIYFIHISYYRIIENKNIQQRD